MYEIEKKQLSAKEVKKNLRETEKSLDLQIPEELKDFLCRTNGGECTFNDVTVKFWGSEELIGYNQSFESKSCIPGVLLFGTDTEGYLFGVDVKEETAKYLVANAGNISADSISTLDTTLSGMMKRIVSGALADLPELCAVNN